MCICILFVLPFCGKLGPNYFVMYFEMVRSSKAGLGEAVEEVEEKKEKTVKGKCIPRKKFSGTCSSKQSKK